MKVIQRILVLFVSVLGASTSVFADGTPITLQNATATYSQMSIPPGLWSASNTIDGNESGSFTSWAICENECPTSTENTAAQTIVWETQDDLRLNPGSQITFRLYHRDGIPVGGHNLGRFSLAYTNDDRSLFADGENIGGDVLANWVAIDPESFSSSGGEAFTKLPDLSLLVSGGSNNYPVYEVTALLSPVAPITGFKLEALEHPSLPFEGPGRQVVNGNFHLSEFVVVTSVIATIIDIKPSNEKNPVNPRSKGKLRVAILTTENFDASTVYAKSVRFGPGAAKPVRHKLDDVDYDGDLDLVFKFKTRKTNIVCGDTEATLTGETIDGQSTIGTDTIKTVGCKPEQPAIVDANVPVKVAKKGNLFDSDLATSWNNNGDMATAWFEVVLDSPSQIEHLRLAPQTNKAYTFNVYVDGVLLGQYMTSSTASVAFQSFELPAGTVGTVVRVESVSHNWFRVHEVELLSN